MSCEGFPKVRLGDRQRGLNENNRSPAEVPQQSIRFLHDGNRPGEEVLRGPRFSLKLAAETGWLLKNDTCRQFSGSRAVRGQLEGSRAFFACCRSGREP